jgi:hypothetical protein
MQRVRIGLTGLAFVFILVLLGAIFSRASDEQPITPNLIDQQMSPDNQELAEDTESEPKEPLAELGVAPGNADNSTSDPQSAPAR